MSRIVHSGINNVHPSLNFGIRSAMPPTKLQLLPSDRKFHFLQFWFSSLLSQDADLAQKWHSLLEKSQKRDFFTEFRTVQAVTLCFFHEIKVCTLFHSIRSKIFYKTWPKQIFFNLFPNPVFISLEKRNFFTTPIPSNKL